MVNEIGNGIGSLLNDNLSDTEFSFLKEDYTGTPVFKLNPDSIDVSNFYNKDTAVIKGGGREVTGYDRFGGYPADALPPEGYKKGDNPLPLSKPDGFNPYKKITNTILTVDFPALVAGKPFPEKVTSDITGIPGTNLYKDYPLYEVSNILWTEADTGLNDTGIVEEGKHYNGKVVFKAKGYIKEDENNLYGSNGRFLGNNTFVINGENISPDSSTNNSKVELNHYGTEVTITKSY